MPASADQELAPRGGKDESVSLGSIAFDARCSGFSGADLSSLAREAAVEERARARAPRCVAALLCSAAAALISC